MTRRPRRRAGWGLAFAGAALALGVLTLVWPSWIEGLFGIDPDEGSGTLEIAIAIGLLLVALVVGTVSSLSLRRRRLASGDLP